MNFTHLRTGKITDELFVVKTMTVNFYLYKWEQGYICFDSGFCKPLILSQLNRLRIDPASITHVFLTHSDFDHAGGLTLFEKAAIYLSCDEEPMITGKQPRMLGGFYNSEIKRAHHLLNDQDIITIGATTIRAITTPGHTIGSMSYWVNESILLVGDTFKLINNQVRPLGNYINMDTQQQKQSIRKLAGLKHVDLACTAHTGYTHQFNGAIRNWK